MNVRLEKIEVANGRSVVSITINMMSMDNLRADLSVLDLIHCGRENSQGDSCDQELDPDHICLETIS